MGGVEGSVLDQFGGEYKFDKFAVSLLASRGTTKNIPLRYGKNITDIKQEENIANTITGIVPFWSDSEGGDVYTLPEKVLHSSNAGSYSSYLTVPIDFSSDFEEKPTELQLRTHGQVYINKYGIGIPKVSIDVSFVNLPDTEEYKGLLNLQQLELCDTIPVEFVKLGISASAKVVKTEYNTLKDRYDRITVGEVGATLAKTITGVSDSVTGLADTTKTNFAKAGHEVDAKINTATANFPTRQDVQYEIDNATAWITATGGIIRALKNSDDEWTDLLCCSATATASTGNVLRLNVNGIGFSFTGWNGPFYQGWTLDGKILIGGTNAPSLTVYDNSNNVIFQVDKTKVIWNAPNSRMYSDGSIYINGGEIYQKDSANNSITIRGAKIDFVAQGQTAGYIAPATYGLGNYTYSGIGLIGDSAYVSGKSKVGLITTEASVSDGDIFIDAADNIEIWADRGNSYIGINGQLSTSTQTGGHIGTEAEYVVAIDKDITVKDTSNVTHTLKFRNGLLVGNSTWGYSNPTGYTIKFDANGGIGTVPSNITFSNNDTETHDMTASNLTKTNYTFYGYGATPAFNAYRIAYTQSNGGGLAPDGTVANISGNWTYTRWCDEVGMPSSSRELTLYAQWYPDDVIIEEEIIYEG